MSDKKRLIVLDISPATETHCGTGKPMCQYAKDYREMRCLAFGSAEIEFDEEADEYKRLPECIAAEKEPA